MPYPPNSMSGASGQPETFVDSVLFAQDVVFSKIAKSVHVINTSDQNGLEVSLDGGVNWLQIGAYGEMSFNANVRQVRIRPQAPAVSADYSIVAILP